MSIDTKPILSYHILSCLIEIWDGTDNLIEEPNNPLVITEVENLEIEDTYTQLIGTASVKFPRGTVIRRTLTAEDESRERKAAEAKGSTYYSVTTTLSDTGIVSETRGNTKKAEVTDFRINQRIRIYLGYIDMEHRNELNKLKSGANKKTVYNDQNTRIAFKKNLNLMFDGYITKVSVDTPIELRCEDLASKLKKKSCPDIPKGANKTVQDFLATGGQHDLLKGTGITLHPDCPKINVGKVSLNTELTVADVLTEWSKYGIFCFISYKDSVPYLSVGRTYFSNAKADSVLNLRTEERSKEIDIQFDYNVAQNDLSLMETNKGFLAVKAQGVSTESKGNKQVFIHVTIRRNPDWKEGDSLKDKYDVLNETKLSKRAMKAGARPVSKAYADKVNLNTYNIVSYLSPTIGISKDALIEEAIRYYEGYHQNGIEGTLTLFGDFALKSAMKVHLTDKRQPMKNGYYLIEEVNTRFGVNGYRQIIKLPFCISLDSENAN